MRRYGDVDRNIRNIEDKTPKPPPPKPPMTPVLSKLVALGATRALSIVELADGLAEATPENLNEAEYPASFLVNSHNKYGVNKQGVFDLLEGRNGQEDSKTLKLVTELLKEKGKNPAETETLLHHIHLQLIREVLDPDRPLLKLQCEVLRPELEFDLDTRFLNSLRNRGPVETRLNEMGPYPSQQELTSRLKKVYAENCGRWRRILEGS